MTIGHDISIKSKAMTKKAFIWIQLKYEHSVILLHLVSFATSVNHHAYAAYMNQTNGLGSSLKKKKKKNPSNVQAFLKFTRSHTLLH